MRHIVDAVAAQGRHGDDTLIHVSRKELGLLKDIGDRLGIKSTTNPHTGLPEAFNWLGTLGGIAGGVAGTFIAPGAGTAAGAALGSGLGTAAGGGTLQQSLTTGLISGVTAYAGGAALGSMSEAGAGLGGEVAGDVAAGGVPPVDASGAVTPSVDASGAAPVDAGANGGAALNNVNPPANTPTAPTNTEAPVDTGVRGSGLKMPQTGGDVGLKPESVTELKAPDTGVKTLPQAKPDFSMSNVGKYLENTPTKDIVKQYGADIGKTVIGQGMAGMMPVGTPEPIAIPGKKSTVNPYGAEYYQGPEGEIRTRSVLKAAQGGLMSFADYDAADAQSDGGYIPGQPQGYAGGGGIGLVRSLQPGGTWGNMTADLYGMGQENKPGWLQGIEPGGFLGATVPGKMDYEDRKRAEEEAKAQQERDAQETAKKLAAQEELKKQQAASVARATGMAGGGIASMGRGRYLQGPGDGMSDSIPADIDGKRPARLATGEFVVPADVVSGLGNGDSTSGAKQLHSMMDRVRMARTGTKKQGKQINPNKVMPV